MSDRPENSFLLLSRILTGEERLSEDLASEYYERIKAAFPDGVGALLTTFSGLSADADN